METLQSVEREVRTVGGLDFGTLQPDIVLMDISMPELNGLLAAAKLKRIQPDVKILTLTRHTDTAYLNELLQAAVSGYVLKQSAPTELLRAIRAVANGGNYLDPAITGKVFDNYAERQNKLRGETGGEPLTARESEVFRRIAANIFVRCRKPPPFRAKILIIKTRLDRENPYPIFLRSRFRRCFAFVVFITRQIENRHKFHVEAEQKPRRKTSSTEIYDE